jgi:flagellar biosynthetic protein FliO
MEMFQQLMIVAVILAVLCGGLRFLKRKGWARTTLRRSRPDGQPRLEVIDRLSLTPHHSLHLVRLADRTLLVGISPNGCNLLECPPSAKLQKSASAGSQNRLLTRAVQKGFLNRDRKGAVCANFSQLGTRAAISSLGPDR